MISEQLLITTEKKTIKRARGEGKSLLSHAIVATNRPDNLAHIQCFAKLNPCSFPAKWLPSPTGRDIGHYLDRCLSPHSRGLPDHTIRLDRGHRGTILSRLGSNMFVHVSSSLSSRSRLIW